MDKSDDSPQAVTKYNILGNITSNNTIGSIMYNQNYEPRTIQKDSKASVAPVDTRHAVVPLDRTAQSVNNTHIKPRLSSFKKQSNTESPYIILPDCKWRIAWDLFIMCVILYAVISVPYKLGFDIKSKGFAQGLDYFFDVMFFVDIVLNFNTGYVCNNTLELVTLRKKIAWHYLKGWFTIDFLSTVPFYLIGELIAGSSDGGDSNQSLSSTKLLRALRLFKLFRMLRILKFSTIRNQIAEALDINQKYFQLISLLAIQFFCAHLLACLWFGISLPTDSSEGKTSWVFNSGLETSSSGMQYLASLYWAYSTMTTVGYGDIYPINDRERIFCIFAMVIGVTVFGYSLLLVAVLLIDGDPREAVRKRKNQMLSSFLSDTGARKDLNRRISAFFTRLFDEKEDVFENGLYSFLYPYLKSVAVISTNNTWPMQLKYVTSMEAPLRAAIVDALRPAVYHAGESIYRQHEVASQIYFLVRGKIRIIVEMKVEHAAFQSLYSENIHQKVNIEGKQENKPRLATILVRDIIDSLSLLHIQESAQSHKNSYHNQNHENAIVKGRGHINPNICQGGLKALSQHKKQAEDRKTQSFYSKCLSCVDNKQTNTGKQCLWGSHIPVPIDRDAEASVFGFMGSMLGAGIRPCTAKVSEHEAIAFVSFLTKSDYMWISADWPSFSNNCKHTAENHRQELLRKLEMAHRGQGTVLEDIQNPTSDKSVEKNSDNTSSKKIVPQIIKNETDQKIEKKDYNIGGERGGFGVDDSVQVFRNAKILLQFWLIHPKVLPKVLWDLFIAILIIYSIIMVPFTIGFDVDMGSEMFYFDHFVVDICFGIDIILCFRTTHLTDNGQYELRSMQIASHYLKGWFTVDFLSTIPIDIIVKSATSDDSNSSGSTRMFKMLRILRLFRLLKLVRLLKLKKFLGRYGNAFAVSPVMRDFLKNFLMLTFCCHAYACLWYFVADTSRKNNAGEVDGTSTNNWIDDYSVGKSGYEWNMSAQNGSIANRYVAATYWTYATFSTVGYGDISANTKNATEMIAAIVGMSLGSIIFAMFIASVFTLASMSNMKKDNMKEWSSRLSEYMTEAHVPFPVQERVKEQLQHFTNQNSPHYNEVDMLAEMPSKLCYECILHTQKDGLLQIPVLAQLNKVFPGALYHLMGCLESYHVVSDSVVFGRGETVSEFYFVTKGELIAVDEKRKPKEIFLPGDSFGEAILSVPSGAPFTLNLSVYAKHNSEIIMMTREGFLSLINVCPTMMEHLFELLSPDEKFDEWIVMSSEWKTKLKCRKQSSNMSRNQKLEFLRETAESEIIRRSPNGGLRADERVIRKESVDRTLSKFKVENLPSMK